MFDELISNAAPKKATLESVRTAQQTLMDEIRKFIIAEVENPSINFNAANERHSTALNIERFKGNSFCIIGVGGIGTWVVRTLVGMGAVDITIFDNDVVGIENVGPQSYDIVDLGRPKVDCMHDAMMRFRGISLSAINAEVTSYSDITRAMNTIPDIMIIATDNMQIRNKLWEELVEREDGNTLPKIYIDCRMSLGAFNLFALPLGQIDQSENDSEYINKFHHQAIFNDSEGVEEHCTERAISYTGAAIAARLCATLHWMNDNYDFDSEEMLKKWMNKDSDLPHHWVESFNTMKWRDCITPALTKEKQDSIVENLVKINEYENMLFKLKEMVRSLQDNFESLGDLLFDQPENRSLSGSSDDQQGPTDEIAETQNPQPENENTDEELEPDADDDAEEHHVETDDRVPVYEIMWHGRTLQRGSRVYLLSRPGIIFTINDIYTGEDGFTVYLQSDTFNSVFTEDAIIGVAD